MKRVAQIALTAGGTLLVFVLLWVFQPTLAMFGGSLAISAALRPLVQRIEARGVARGIAILIVYLLILAGIAVGALIYGVGVASEVGAAAELLPQQYAALASQWQHGTTLQQTVARGLPSFDALIRGGASGDGLATIGGTLALVAGNTLNLLVFAFAAFSLAYYWLIESTHFERLWLSLLPVGARIRARQIWRAAEEAVGAYIRTTIVATVVSALALLALYRLIGLPFGTLLALLGGISQIVPRLGPALALLVAVAVAFLTLAPWQVAAVLAVGAAIHIITHKLTVRSMKQEALKVNPLLQVLLLLALAYIGGLWAMIFAPPLAALLQVLHASILITNAVPQPQESAIELLAARLGRIRSSPDGERVEVASALRRSDDLLKQARALLDGNQ